MTDTAEVDLTEARRLLARALDGLDTEIRTYPVPVSGCDAQYNHLLAERRRAHQALSALSSEVHIPTPRAP